MKPIEPQPFYLNDIQNEVIYTGAKDTILCAGRALGKGVIHAMWNLRMQARFDQHSAFDACALGEAGL